MIVLVRFKINRGIYIKIASIHLNVACKTQAYTSQASFKIFENLKE